MNGLNMSRDVSKMFEDYKGMIYKQAWKIARKYDFWNRDLSFEELCSDGFLIFLQALDRYDESKGSFSTFLSNNLRGIVDIHFRENKDIMRVYYDDALLMDKSTPSFDSFQRVLELYDSASTELSKEAKMVFDYIISNPEKRHTENSIRVYFRSQYSWTVKQAELAFRELKKWWLCFSAV